MNQTTKPIIELVDVIKTFGSQVVLDQVSFAVPIGQTTVIAGGSGQGKSVVLKLILGLLSPDAGQILVEGQDICKMRRHELNQVRKAFGVLFQGAALLDSLSVFDNVALPLEERTRMKSKEVRDRVLSMLAKVGLDGHDQKFPAQLSGGMKKRAGLARALMLEPKIVLFDEPTTGLDPEKSMEIYRLFFRTQQQFGYTAVIVSHDIPKIFNLADQVILLNHGKLVSFDNPRDIQGVEANGIEGFISSTMGNIYRSKDLE